MREQTKEAALWIGSILFFGLVLGTVVHEVVGHALPASLLGYEVTDVQILFLQVSPLQTNFVLPQQFGSVLWHGQPSPKEQVLLSLTPAFIALLVSLSAILILLKTNKYKKILSSLTLWFIDPLNNHVISRSIDYHNVLRTGYSLVPLQVLTILVSLLVLSAGYLYFSGKLKGKEELSQKVLLLSLAFVFLLFVYTLTWS